MPTQMGRARRFARLQHDPDPKNGHRPRDDFRRAVLRAWVVLQDRQAMADRQADRQAISERARCLFDEEAQRLAKDLVTLDSSEGALAKQLEGLLPVPVALLQFLAPDDPEPSDEAMPEEASDQTIVHCMHDANVPMPPRHSVSLGFLVTVTVSMCFYNSKTNRGHQSGRDCCESGCRQGLWQGQEEGAPWHSHPD